MTKNKKKKLIVLLLALASLLIAVAGSYAYIEHQTVARNIITTGKIEVKVNEYADTAGTPFPETGVSGVMPGAAVTKIVEIENTADSADAWVRVMVEKTITLAEGVSGTPDPSLVSIDFDTANWTFSDGWYYYNARLAPGERTAPLFTQVVFSNSMDNMYQESTAEVKVTAQAVQVIHNGDTALDAVGWPAEVAGNTSGTGSAPAQPHDLNGGGNGGDGV